MPLNVRRSGCVEQAPCLVGIEPQTCQVGDITLHGISGHTYVKRFRLPIFIPDPCVFDRKKDHWLTVKTIELLHRINGE